jgi:alpha-N-arabinofuranosidase
MWDTHHYEPPHFFISGFDYWDNWQEETNNSDVTIFVGEYSVFQIDTPSEVDNLTSTKPNAQGVWSWNVP